MKESRAAKRVSIFLKSWAGSVLIAVIIASSFKSAVADWNEVPTGSMKPTIVEGDRIFVNKLAYDLRVPFTALSLWSRESPARGDIVVLRSPGDGTRLVKRVIGLPGDRLEMVNDRLIINGAAARYSRGEREGEGIRCVERYGAMEHQVMLLPRLLAPRSFGPVVVPGGSYFVMGDNRDNSADSRYFGFVDRGLIVGRASMVVMSLDYEEHRLPRKERFFKKLL